MTMVKTSTSYLKRHTPVSYPRLAIYGGYHTVVSSLEYKVHFSPLCCCLLCFCRPLFFRRIYRVYDPVDEPGWWCSRSVGRLHNTLAAKLFFWSCLAGLLLRTASLAVSFAMGQLGSLAIALLVIYARGHFFDVYFTKVFD